VSYVSTTKQQLFPPLRQHADYRPQKTIKRQENKLHNGYLAED